MATARQPRSSPPAAHDFVARIASWRTSPSTSDYSPIASVEEPLLARTDAGWSRTPTEDVTKWTSRSRSSEAGVSTSTSTTHTRRWLVGCFAVIILAGSGWRISTTGNADLGRPEKLWNAAHESFPGSTGQGGALALHDEQPENAADLEDAWASPQREGSTTPVAATSPTAIVSPAPETAPSPIPSWNVHPRPRPPSADLDARSTTKYLAYENHSGFHNRKFRRNSRNPIVPSTQNQSSSYKLYPQSANPSSMHWCSPSCSIARFSSHLPDSGTPCRGNPIPNTLSSSRSGARPDSNPTSLQPPIRNHI